MYRWDNIYTFGQKLSRISLINRFLIFTITFIGFALPGRLSAQPLEIPDHIYFAGMELHLSRGLRDQLLKQVQTITKSKTYFEARVKQADTHFPLIEAVFEQEGLPKDFRFLIIQESSFNAESVSSSNAVGYWQFKRESAQEVGLRIDSKVDERKHLIESSRGAAKYIKKNYLLTSNWLYALIAYNTGYGGVRPLVQAKYAGASAMDLDTDLHWYALKFLAYKLAYEDKVGYSAAEWSLLPYSQDTRGKSLAEISAITGIQEDKIREYNKWLLEHRIPDDKDYSVLLPVFYLEKKQVAARLGISDTIAAASDNKVTTFAAPIKDESASAVYTGVPYFVTQNGLEAILARPGDNAARIAFVSGISKDKFLKYNDMEKYEDVVVGKVYYLEAKNNKAITLKHTVSAGESLWDIAQKYGVKISQLRKKNRMEDNEALLPGRVLYLKNKRPSHEAILYMPVETKTPYNPIPPEKTQNTISPIKENKDSISAPRPIVPPATSTKVVPNPQAKDPNQLTQPSDSLQTASSKPALIIPFTEDKGTKKHIVQQGQTLYGLSRYYKVSMDSLRKWNELGLEGVKMGQSLWVSKSLPVRNGDFWEYQARPMQNLQALSDSLKISVMDLQQWNLKSNTDLLPGECLKIYKYYK